jgi:hypothetical protein
VEPTASDLCATLDRISRSADNAAALDNGFALYEAVRDSGEFRAISIETVARLVGDLVTGGELAFRSKHPGSRTPPPGVGWTSSDLQSHLRYSLTEAGRREADRARRLRRDHAAGNALEGRFADGELDVLGPDGAEAVLHHVAELETALRESRWPAAVGAAKDLVESAAHAALAARGEPAAPRTKLQVLVRTAVAAEAEPYTGWSLSRSVATVAQSLGELRNAEGSGHGRAAPPQVTAVEAEFAAAISVSLARLILRRHALLTSTR